MKARLVCFIAAAGLALVLSCGGGQQKSDLWTYYDGCDENQCTHWANACEAECANKGGGLTQCQNTCQVKRNECNEHCGAGPGNK